MYEYASWNASTPEEKYLSDLGKSRALKMQGQYAAASEILQKIPVAALPASAREEAIYEMVLNEYLDQDYASALSKGLFGQQVFQDTLTNPVYHQYLLLMALSAYQNDQWNTGKGYGLRYLILTSPDHPDRSTEFIELNEADLPKIKNENTARWLSIFLPGSGQLYAGSAGEGLTSFLLHAAGLGLAGWAAFSGYYVSAWLGAALVVQRVYTGGRERAVELVQKRNRLKKEAYLQPIYDLLLTAI